MKIIQLATPNPKGQIVIPKEMREKLGIGATTTLNITLRGNGLYLYPIEEVITRGEREPSYLKILQKTQGAWADEDWASLRKKRKQIEMAASARRKQAW